MVMEKKREKREREREALIRYLKLIDNLAYNLRVSFLDASRDTASVSYDGKRSIRAEGQCGNAGLL